MFTDKTRRIVTCSYDKRACVIEGIAVTARINKNKQSFNPLGCELSVPIPLMFDHKQLVGEVVYLKKTETEVYVRATLFPDELGYHVWQLIKIGELKGLSIGLGFGRNQFQILENDGIDYFTRFRLSEVSVVFDPANVDCRFKIYPGGAQKMVHPSKTKALETIARLNRKYGPTNHRKVSNKKRDGNVVHKRYDNVIHKKLASDKTTNTDLDFVLSDSSVDRYGDIVLSGGWILDNFKRNPIALFSHSSSFPIGKWRNLKVSDGALRGTLELAPLGTSSRIDEIIKLIGAGILKAVSVGFTPLKSKPRPGDEPGIIYLEQELVECSVVSVPANSNALVQAKKLGVSAETQALVFKNRRV